MTSSENLLQNLRKSSLRFYTQGSLHCEACFMIFISPMPLSFHWPLSKRYTLALWVKSDVHPSSPGKTWECNGIKYSAVKEVEEISSNSNLAVSTTKNSNVNVYSTLFGKKQTLQLFRTADSWEKSTWQPLRKKKKKKKKKDSSGHHSGCSKLKKAEDTATWHKQKCWDEQSKSDAPSTNGRKKHTQPVTIILQNLGVRVSMGNSYTFLQGVTKNFQRVTSKAMNLDTFWRQKSNFLRPATLVVACHVIWLFWTSLLKSNQATKILILW